MTPRANPYFQPLQVNYSNRPNPALSQADEILQHFRASGNAACGITYSANSNQTAALNAYYKAPDATKWGAVVASFNGAANQGAVMGDFLSKLTPAEQQNFRILPITTMTAAGGPTTPEQLNIDLANVSAFINNSGGRVFGWQNEGSNPDKESHFAIGGGVAATHGFTNGSSGSKYVVNYLDALQASSAANQPPPPVPEPPPHLPTTKAEADEQVKRHNEDERNKSAEQHKKDWQENNDRRWTNIKNPGAVAAASNAGLSAGADKPAVEYEFGYYKLDGINNKHLALLHFFQDPKTGALSVNICKSPGWNSGSYEDYGNGRDLLQSQGCTTITYDYPEVKDVDPTDTVKFLLDSIYKKVENFDDKGNPRPGTANEYKATPAGIELGPTVHAYIEANIGYLDSKNPWLRKRAEQCQKMLELETLSQQLQRDHSKGLKAASPTPPVQAAAAVPPPPPPPPGNQAAPNAAQPQAANANNAVPDAPGVPPQKKDSIHKELADAAKAVVDEKKLRSASPRANADGSAPADESKVVKTKAPNFLAVEPEVNLADVLKEARNKLRSIDEPPPPPPRDDNFADNNSIAPPSPHDGDDNAPPPPPPGAENEGLEAQADAKDEVAAEQSGPEAEDKAADEIIEDFKQEVGEEAESNEVNVVPVKADDIKQADFPDMGMAELNALNKLRDKVQSSTSLDQGQKGEFDKILEKYLTDSKDQDPKGKLECAREAKEALSGWADTQRDVAQKSGTSVSVAVNLPVKLFEEIVNKTEK